MNPRKFRILSAPKGMDLRSREVIDSSYTTGDKKTAIYGAIQDIKAIGNGARFIVQRFDGYQWVEVQCGELIRGDYYPRNNY